jgi:hypothetical protein
MKSIFKKSIIVAAFLFGAVGISNAQVKIGSNPTTIGANSNLEVEATNARKVIVNKADGTVVIENTPLGAATDRYLSVDASGNVRAVVPVTSGITNIYRGTIVTPINVGACPASLTTSGYFTSAACALPPVNSNVGKNILTITFPSVGSSNYDVFSTNNLNTADSPDSGNDVLLPMIYEKTDTSFKVFLEETSATQIGTSFSFMIVK